MLTGRRFHTARWLRDRWAGAGWVEGHQLEPRGPSFLWLTSRGRQVATSPYRYWIPNPGRARHIEAVTEIRIHFERTLQLGAWECERELATTTIAGNRRPPHLPDGVLVTGQERIAVEVELTRKGDRRLDEILPELARRYRQVWYFAHPTAFTALDRKIAQLPWPNIHVYHYPPRPGEPATSERASW